MPSTPQTRVLIIGYVWPEPRSSAAGGHMMQIIESFLQEGWHITFSSPAGIGEHKADLATLGIDEVNIELNNSSFDPSTVGAGLLAMTSLRSARKTGAPVSRASPLPHRNFVTHVF